MKKRAIGKRQTATAKRFVALARVSSREQEREGFSLDVQVEALQRYADRAGGQIVKLYRIAETASKTDERKTFKDLIAYAKQNAAELDGLLFYKVDRAARNLFDYVELERLEGEPYCIPFISVSQPTEHTPAGRMQRRVLASMASFYTEQQSIDVQEGIARRVQAGLFVGLAPYGYRNVRIDGRSVVQIDEEQAKKVRYIFDLYAHHNCTIDQVVQRLTDEQIIYTTAQPLWACSKVHKILRDRAYIGEVLYRGQWHPGAQQPIIERVVWSRVQALLGECVYKAHELTYAGELIRCGHCGHPVTGETVVKKTTGKEYIYYRCSKYNRAGHPRARLTEAQLDEQIMALFARIRQPQPVREWFQKMLRLWVSDQQQESRSTADDIQRELSRLRDQQDRLLNLRLMEEIEPETFARKNTELRDRIAALTLQLESAHRRCDERADTAQKVFELSQSLTERWVASLYAEKRQILEMVCLNFTLDGATLVPTMRKPFDILVKGLCVSSSRGDWI
jgi:DNA invertase Pin-like site-specific DNA recombinase